MDNDDLFPRHTGGSGRLRALLQGLGEDQERLTNDPRYQEGYDDGYTVGRLEAEMEAQCLVRALIKLYDKEPES